MKKKSKGIIIGVIIALVLALIVGIVLIIRNANHAYRFVEVEDFDGKVKVTRDDDQVEVFEGLRLQPSDKVATKEDSSIELLVDTDKHIYAEENTTLVIEATGDEEEGKVLVKLKEGNALFEIENKLNDESTFEVKSPNATISVRGTIFRVEYMEDIRTTRLTVIEGIVHVEPSNDDLDTLEAYAGDVVYITDDSIDLEEPEEEDTSENDVEEETDVAVVEEEEPEEIVEEELEEVLIVGEIAIEELDTVFGSQVNEAQLAFLMDCICSEALNNRSDYTSRFGYKLASTNFRTKVNPNNEVIELISQGTGTNEKYYYYNLGQAEYLCKIFGGSSLAETFPDRIEDNLYKAILRTDVTEDQAPTNTTIGRIYVDEEGFVYVEGKQHVKSNSGPDDYGRLEWDEYATAVMEKDEYGEYVLTKVEKKSLEQLGY